MLLGVWLLLCAVSIWAWKVDYPLPVCSQSLLVHSVKLTINVSIRIMVWNGGLGRWVHEGLGGWYKPVVEKERRRHIMLGVWMRMLGKLRLWKFSSQFVSLRYYLNTRAILQVWECTGIYSGPMKARHTPVCPTVSVILKISNGQFLPLKSVPGVPWVSRDIACPEIAISNYSAVLFCFLFFLFFFSRGKSITPRCTVI